MKYFNFSSLLKCTLNQNKSNHLIWSVWVMHYQLSSIIYYISKISYLIHKHKLTTNFFPNNYVMVV